MKSIVMTIVCIFVAFTAAAQESAVVPSMNKERLQGTPDIKEQIKKMKIEADAKLLSEEPKDAIQAVMAMSKCMEKSIGEKTLNGMEKRSREFDKQIKELCKAGKEDEAKELTKQYAQQFSQSQEYKAMKLCADKYKATMNDPMFDGIRKKMGRADADKKDVCGVKEASS